MVHCPRAVAFRACVAGGGMIPKQACGCCAPGQGTGIGILRGLGFRVSGLAGIIDHGPSPVR